MCRAVRPVTANYKASKNFCKIPQDPIQTLASPDPYFSSPPSNLLLFQAAATSSSPNSLFQAPLLLHDG